MIISQVGYPLPPQGTFQGSDGNTYRYDLSDRQYYGYNSQKGMVWIFHLLPVMASKSIYNLNRSKRQ